MKPKPEPMFTAEHLRRREAVRKALSKLYSAEMGLRGVVSVRKWGELKKAKHDAWLELRRAANLLVNGEPK